MVEENRILPVDFRMAVFALRPKRALVNIVIEVTRVAFSCQLDFEYRFDMAVTAQYFLVRPVEDKVRVSIMIEMPGRPFPTAVAAVALIAVVAVVMVILQMAGNANCFEFVFERGIRVTVTAGQFCVFAFQ